MRNGIAATSVRRRLHTDDRLFVRAAITTLCTAALPAEADGRALLSELSQSGNAA